MSHHITVYGSSWCSDCKRAKRFLGDQQVEYKWVDVEQDEKARLFVEKHNDGKTIIPTILFDDGTIMVEPSNAQLAEKLGLATMAEHRFYDLIVIGGGPAGLPPPSMRRAKDSRSWCSSARRSVGRRH